MSDILFQYHKVEPTTWVYLSSLLMIGLFFKFSRFWSIRNLDVVLLILFAPGLILVDWGVSRQAAWAEQMGYVWLFSVTGIFLLRMLLDPMMVRRPLLEPNLSVGGMVFIGTALLIFLMANVLNSEVEAPVAQETSTIDAPGSEASAAATAALARSAEFLPPAADANLAASTSAGTNVENLPRGPGYPPLSWLPQIPTQVTISHDRTFSAEGGDRVIAIAAARVLAIVSHIMLILGMVLIGYRHFDNVRTGIAAALLYLLMPYTAQLTGCVNHVLPAAMLVWAVEAYRRPISSGVFMGLAIGTAYYPLFLLPLWMAFYWQRGLARFVIGVLAAVAVLVGSLAFFAGNAAEFWALAKAMFAWPAISGATTSGFWSFDFIDPVYRIPVVAAFVALSLSFALWPAQKNLGTLLSCSAAVMLAAQYWNPAGGGLLLAWFMPLVLLTIFRPNLEDRVALSVLDESWLGRRRMRVVGNSRAA
jgi:hypothetical protein